MKSVVDYNADEFIEFVKNETEKASNKCDIYELINGCIYMMSSPNEIHHDLSKFIEKVLDEYFLGKGCKVYHAPFDLFLYDPKHYTLLTSAKSKCRNVFVPDIMVVCDKNKRKSDGIHGAPDLIVEVVSKSSVRLDTVDKLHAYMSFGVKEYWIVNPMTCKIMVCLVSDEEGLLVDNYTFDDVVESVIFESLSVDFKLFEGVSE